MSTSWIKVNKTLKQRVSTRLMFSGLFRVTDLTMQVSLMCVAGFCRSDKLIKDWYDTCNNVII